MWCFRCEKHVFVGFVELHDDCFRWTNYTHIPLDLHLQKTIGTPKE